MTEDRGRWMQTASGGVYYPMDPRAGEVSILDIASALSKICRFNGHSHAHYSVAQHSVLVSRLVSEENAKWGLMHDAAEAYVGDMIRPLKHGPLGKLFEEIEHRNLEVIAERFELELPIPDEVIHYDTQILISESLDIMKGQAMSWGVQGDPPVDKISPWDHGVAYHDFMNRFQDLFDREW